MPRTRTVIHLRTNPVGVDFGWSSIKKGLTIQFKLAAFLARNGPWSAGERKRMGEKLDLSVDGIGLCLGTEPNPKAGEIIGNQTIPGSRLTP